MQLSSLLPKERERRCVKQRRSEPVGLYLLRSWRQLVNLDSCETGQGFGSPSRSDDFTANDGDVIARIEIGYNRGFLCIGWRETGRLDIRCLRNLPVVVEEDLSAIGSIQFEGRILQTSEAWAE